MIFMKTMAFLDILHPFQRFADGPVVEIGKHEVVFLQRSFRLFFEVIPEILRNFAIRRRLSATT